MLRVPPQSSYHCTLHMCAAQYQRRRASVQHCQADVISKRHTQCGLDSWASIFKCLRPHTAFGREHTHLQTLHGQRFCSGRLVESGRLTPHDSRLAHSLQTTTRVMGESHRSWQAVLDLMPLERHRAARCNKHYSITTANRISGQPTQVPHMA
jgi:hypothetical protein